MVKTAKISEIPEIPEKWYIVVTPQNHKIIDKWKMTTMWKEKSINYSIVYWMGRGGDEGRGSVTEITLEQFKKYVLKEEETKYELIQTNMTQWQACKACAFTHDCKAPYTSTTYPATNGQYYDKINNIYKGWIKDFPKEVVDKMLERQVEQGNEKNISVFENYCNADQNEGGFCWIITPENHDFWKEVILNKNFDLFFEKYPKNDYSKQAETYNTLLEYNKSDINITKEYYDKFNKSNKTNKIDIYVQSNKHKIKIKEYTYLNNNKITKINL